MEDIKVDLTRPSDKYVFLSKLQINLDKATCLYEVVKSEEDRQQEKQEKEEKRREERKVYLEDECPVCFENLSGKSKVVPSCGHEICLACYSHLVSLDCVKCRVPYK